MTNAASLTIVIDALNNTNKTLTQIRNDLQGIEQPAQRASSSLGNVSKALSAGITFSAFKEGVGIIKDLAEAAAEDAASQARLKQAVIDSGSDFASYSASLSDVVKKGQELGFTDDQTRQSLSLLVAETGNVSEAMRRYALAQDLARGTGLDIVQASRLLGKVTDENTRVLGRYGITVQKGASETELLASVQQRFGGQAGAFAETAAGKYAIFVDKIHELKESLGGLTLGPLTKIVSDADQAISNIQKLTGSIHNAGEESKHSAISLHNFLSFSSNNFNDISGLRIFNQAMKDLGLAADTSAPKLRSLSDSENEVARSTNAVTSALQGLGGLLGSTAGKTSNLVQAQIEALRGSEAQKAATEAAYTALRNSNSETDRAIAKTHDEEAASKSAAETKRLQAEADAEYAKTVPGMVLALAKQADQTLKQAEANREYAAANGLLVDSASNLLPTMSELVGKTQDSYIATQRDTEARREAYAAMGLETDSMGNLIQTTEQLVRAQEDSINASIRQSNATLQVAQQDFPHLVQQERQSILASQAMAKASAEANRQLIAEGLIADNTANSLDHLASAQYSVADYGTAALAPNFRPQDFTTIRNSPTVNGQGRSSSGGGASPSGGSVYRSSTSERPPAGFVGSFGGASYPAPRSSSTRSSARVVNQGTVINGNVYVTTSAQSFNAMQRI